MLLQRLLPLSALVVALVMFLASTPAKGLMSPPTAVEDKALKIFNGVSPEARSWILDQAQALARQSYSATGINVEAIHTAAIRRFDSKIRLKKSQQDELALAVLYQVIKLDEAEYERLKALPKWVGDPAQGMSENMSAEIKAMGIKLKETRSLAEWVRKRIGDSRDSVVGKL
jgi:hypothetical protein